MPQNLFISSKSGGTSSFGLVPVRAELVDDRVQHHAVFFVAEAKALVRDGVFREHVEAAALEALADAQQRRLEIAASDGAGNLGPERRPERRRSRSSFRPGLSRRRRRRWVLREGGRNSHAARPICGRRILPGPRISRAWALRGGARPRAAPARSRTQCRRWARFVGTYSEFHGTLPMHCVSTVFQRLRLEHRGGRNHRFVQRHMRAVSLAHLGLAPPDR